MLAQAEIQFVQPSAKNKFINRMRYRCQGGVRNNGLQQVKYKKKKRLTGNGYYDKVYMFEIIQTDNKAEYPLSPYGNWADRRS